MAFVFCEVRLQEILGETDLRDEGRTVEQRCFLEYLSHLQI